MALNVWTESSGYNFGTFLESSQIYPPVSAADPVTWQAGTTYTRNTNVVYNGKTYFSRQGSTNKSPDTNPIYWAQYILLPANAAGITFSIISGNLPEGMFLKDNYIFGTPFVISTTTNISVCIRATDGTSISDRTFKFTVDGSAPPAFITQPGALGVGIHDQLYVKSGTFISYQLEGFDLTTLSGDTLNYFISSGDGHLPPGLTMSSSGLISGYVEPILSNTVGAQYNEVFDASMLRDFSANFQFKVTLSNGVALNYRIFRILVVGTDEFRADSTSELGFAGGFTSDVTYLRQPVWLTDSNLGIYRANNYITIPVTLYDNTNTAIRLENTNHEVYAIAEFLENNFSTNIAGSRYVSVGNVSGTIKVGYYFSLEHYLTSASNIKYQIAAVEQIGDAYKLTLSSAHALEIDIPVGTAFYIGTECTLPVGTSFDNDGGELYGSMPYQPAITKSFSFTINASRYSAQLDEFVNSAKTFNITILGDITSEIVWGTDRVLGELPANYPCVLSIKASSSVPNATVVYTVIGGALPPGLSLNLDGEIIGMVNQYYVSDTLKGLTTFSEYDVDGNVIVAAQTFDNNTTTFDRTFKFTVQATDQYNYSASSREFTLAITTPNDVSYSNISVRPLLVPEQRANWASFINDTTIFTPSSIYRVNDRHFGVQSTLSMLIFGGIETMAARAYAEAIALNHKNKRFVFSNVKKALASSNNGDVYEVIYIQMLDPMEPNDTNLAESIRTDSATYYPSSITNWQKRIASAINSHGVPAKVERNYLPLWMRTTQPGYKEQLGFVLAVPICFCKVGTADDILLNIKHSTFDFKNLDYTVDRYIIDAVTDSTGDKYLAFSNDRTTL
jgi:hypothetical protein